MLERALVYVHAAAPPAREGGGTAVLMHALLAAMPADRLLTVAATTTAPDVKSGQARLLPGRYCFVLKKGLRGNRFRLGRVVNAALNVVLALLAGVRAGIEARRIDAGWVVAVVDDGFSQLAGFVAARVARIPYLLMVFDLWEENAYTEVERGLARLLERPLFRRADTLIVHNEQMADHYREKHGIRGHVLPTAVNAGDQARSRAVSEPPYEVLFAGAIYWAQEDAIRRLAEAVAGMTEFELALVGSWSNAENLARRAISAARVEGQVSPVVFRERLAKADVLFLGLSFGSDHPQVINTASPAKLPEYMLSGRPLLVHAPRGSHVAEYARANDFAEVVDEPDVAKLAAALRRIVADPEAAATRAQRARQLALERHAAPVVRARFAALAREAATP